MCDRARAALSVLRASNTIIMAMGSFFVCVFCFLQTLRQSRFSSELGLRMLNSCKSPGAVSITLRILPGRNTACAAARNAERLNATVVHNVLHTRAAAASCLRVISACECCIYLRKQH